MNADKLIELGVIPVIFVIQTFISYIVSRVVAKCCGFNRRASNFVTAMGVFGNSNSLPISLVISLSQTLKGLHWDKIPGDNDDEVAARGILYLLIFQQLGQLVRWSWGYHVLLAPKSKYEEYNDEAIEEGRYRDQPADETQRLIEGISDTPYGTETHDGHRPSSPTHSVDSGALYEPAGRTPVGGSSGVSPYDSDDEDRHDETWKAKKKQAAYDADLGDQLEDHEELNRIAGFPQGVPVKLRRVAGRWERKTRGTFGTARRRVYDSLPRPVQLILKALRGACKRVYHFLWEFMNPPLWAMLIAVVVASVPDLQALFFRDESFVKTSVTSAIKSSAGVAVPLILVVLGANLARNTQGGDEMDPEEKQIGTRLLVASLVSRMVLPTLIMAPILALFAKYVPVSILDDPIFVIVCFLLTGAPSALQLAQICQINNVYETVMGKILFQSYVVWSVALPPHLPLFLTTYLPHLKLST